MIFKSMGEVLSCLEQAGDSIVDGVLIYGLAGCYAIPRYWFTQQYNKAYPAQKGKAKEHI